MPPSQNVCMVPILAFLPLAVLKKNHFSHFFNWPPIFQKRFRTIQLKYHSLDELYNNRVIMQYLVVYLWAKGIACC